MNCEEIVNTFNYKKTTWEIVCWLNILFYHKWDDFFMNKYNFNVKTKDWRKIPYPCSTIKLFWKARMGLVKTWSDFVPMKQMIYLFHFLQQHNYCLRCSDWFVCFENSSLRFGGRRKKNYCCPTGVSECQRNTVIGFKIPRLEGCQ